MIYWKTLTVVVTVFLATGAHAANWQMAADKSQLKYVATYEGQQVSGHFRRFDVKLTFDPQQPQKGSLQVTVETAAADMNSSDVNKAIKEPQWFGVDQYPVAKFVSRQIRQQAAMHFMATGTLSLKGVEKTVQVPFTWQASGNTATMSGHMSLRRTDFNIGTGEWSSGKAIGLEVTLTYTIQLRKSTLK